MEIYFKLVKKARLKFCETCTVTFISYETLSRISPRAIFCYVFESMAACQDLLFINTTCQDTERPCFLV